MIHELLRGACFGFGFGACFQLGIESVNQVLSWRRRRATALASNPSEGKANG